MKLWQAFMHLSNTRPLHYQSKQKGKNKHCQIFACTCFLKLQRSRQHKKFSHFWFRVYDHTQEQKNNLELLTALRRVQLPREEEAGKWHRWDDANQTSSPLLLTKHADVTSQSRQSDSPTKHGPIQSLFSFCWHWHATLLCVDIRSWEEMMVFCLALRALVWYAMHSFQAIC